MREFMKIVGVNEYTIILSWNLTYGVILLVGSGLQTVAGMLGMFASSSAILIFAFFFLFGLSVLAFAFMVSAFFSKARVGGFVAMILFFAMYFVSSGVSAETSENTKSMLCLISSVALALGFKTIATVEATDQGIIFSSNGVASDDFRFSASLLFFSIDSILYTLAGLYLRRSSRRITVRLHRGISRVTIVLVWKKRKPRPCAGSKAE